MMARFPRRTRGVSLIEALVAVAVMGFGILGVVGLQATLRANADISKQRAQALRLAQQAVEDWRAFTVMDTTAGQLAYADIVTEGAASVDESENYNTTFSLTRTVADTATGRGRNLLAEVSWADRAGVSQTVTLATIIAGIAPELAGSVSLPGDNAPVRQPGGRNPNIPPGSVSENGKSIFTPPGGGGVTWTFDNNTGIITTICTPSAGDPVCNPANGYLLSGFVRFATLSEPDSTSSEYPSSPPFFLDLAVDLTAPPALNGTTTQCFEEVVTGLPGYLAYFCVIPLPAGSTRWSGKSKLVFDPTSLLSTALSDTDKYRFKVCRYTPANTDTPTNGNAGHPLNYADVNGPLGNQNFLVISAGDGSTAYVCPGDNTSTPVNTNTYKHDPLS